MPVKVESSLDEPIVTFIFSGTLDEDTVSEADAQAEALLERMGTYYALIDMRALAEAQPLPELLIFQHERVKPVFLKAAGQETGAHDVPGFETRDEAVLYIERMIAQQAPGSSNT